VEPTAQIGHNSDASEVKHDMSARAQRDAVQLSADLDSAIRGDLHDAVGCMAGRLRTARMAGEWPFRLNGSMR
jgi:hypothetical protein